MSKLAEPGTIDPSQHRQLVTNILVLKRHIRRFENYLKQNRYFHKYFKAKLDTYSHQPPKIRLFYRDLEVKAEALVKETGEEIAEDRERLKQGYLDLEQCMRAYDASPFRNWHEVAQVLGISHVLLDHFLKAHEIEHVSLQLCALHHAEVWGERERSKSRRVTETRSRDSILYQTLITNTLSLIKTNSAVRYRFWKGVDSLLPDLLPPEQVQPERNFEVIADSLGEGPVNPTKDSQTELWP